MRQFRKVFKSKKLRWQTQAIFLLVLISSFALVITDALFRTNLPNPGTAIAHTVKVTKHPQPPAPYTSWDGYRKAKAAQQL